MIKVTSQFKRALMLILVCMCAACNPPESAASNKPLTSHRYTGCGIAQTGTGNFMPMKIHVLDHDRTYHLRIPSTYNPNRKYPLIFRWHGSGGDGLSGGLGIEYSAGDDAIIVSANGLDKYWRIESDSVDLALFDSMLETVSAQYCIDRHRVFSYGFSIGGLFTNLLACERGDVLRASAAIASGPAGNNCKGKVATWLLHDSDDDAIPISMGEAARDRALAINGCSANTVDEGNGCVRYQGCDIAPVVWCESAGIGHNIRGDFAPAQVWKFFESFE